ncbi:MAG: hypothetical protein M5R42_09565 [Rhodocyclaceae bacterium]|nr:hypothetical protein [Rhodocyclaceae bacterium]
MMPAPDRRQQPARTVRGRESHRHRGVLHDLRWGLLRHLDRAKKKFSSMNCTVIGVSSRRWP